MNLQEFYFSEFNITNNLLKGFINGSPYIAASLLGCWLTQPLNNLCGRRGTLAISCGIAAVTAFLQAASVDWGMLVGFRLLLGIAVGAKSSTAPIYAAESAPAKIRGAMTMMWQMWTAFGIMLGYAASLACQDIRFPDEYAAWRWMIGITALPPIFVLVFIYTLPESPRWYMNRGKEGDYEKAYTSMCRLRAHKVLAARDLLLVDMSIEDERKKMDKEDKRMFFAQVFTVPRVRRAAIGAWFCMIMQQFCGGK